MSKRVITFLLAVFMMVSFIGTGMAFAEPEGNKRKGKYTYRKVYKACMERGEVEVAKPIVNPDSKTQAEWVGVFENKAFEEFKCAEEWAGLSDEQLQDILAYLYSGASDSPTPAKCK